MTTTTVMAGPLDSVFTTVSGLFTSYGPAVVNGLIIVFTVSGQSVRNNRGFPCAHK
jgi:hypothetical protein